MIKDIPDVLGAFPKQLWLGGAWREGERRATFEVINPSTEAVIAEVPRGDAADVDAAVKAAREALREWARWEARERSRLLTKVAHAITAQADDLARVETLDSGKPLSLAEGEVLGAARYFEYYAGLADKLHGETVPIGNDYLDFTLLEPVGVTAHIVPWNMPLNMIARSLAPALAAGNTAVVKPAEQTPLNALRFAQVLHEVGLPAGVYNVVTGLGEEAGAALANHGGVDSLTFTGSVATGSAVMASAARHIKPVVLELGGKSPQLVFEDADLAVAAKEISKGIFLNSGQYCDAGSRLLVHASRHDELLERLVTLTRNLSLGAGVEDKDMGPLVSQEHFERVMGYVRSAQEEGAKVVTGGRAPEGKGYFLEPTIFDEVTPDMAIAREEIFGPVLSVMTFRDEDEAVALANDSDYGLGAGIFTRDINRALRTAKRVQAGYVMVNEYFTGDIGAPFGGYKKSGIGRERGLVTLQSYTQIKNVAVRIGDV